MGGKFPQYGVRVVRQSDFLRHEIARNHLKLSNSTCNDFALNFFFSFKLFISWEVEDTSKV